MEFVLLPLLLLLGLLTTLDGGDGGSGSDDENVNDTDNDTLSGSGTERIYGDAGDDELWLEGQSTGLGGIGDDTIYAQGGAVGYGLDGDDSLTGADNATIKGGDGDDALTVSGEAFAQGGNGNDVLIAQDDALAEGGAGDDGLLGVDNATIRGGEGNDRLTAGGEAQAEAGAGDDTLMLSDSARGDGGAGNDVIYHSGAGEAYGGAGDDRLTAGGGLASIYGDAGNDVLYGTGTAELSGGTGDDVLFMDLQRADALAQGTVHGTPSTLSGGEGADDFVLTGFPLEINAGSSADSAFSYSGPVVIDDFDPAVDSLGLVLAKADLNDLSMSVSYSAATNATTVTLSQGRAIDGDFTNRAIAKIELRGVAEFDPADLKLYADTDLTPLDLTLQGTAGNDLLSSFGHPSGESVMDGAAGNDNLFLQDGTVLGGAGNDTIDGQGTLVGGAGDDFLYVHTDLLRSINHREFLMKGQADGGDGNDTISAQTDVTIGDSWSATGPLVVLGGAGDDYIVASDIYRIDAGSGNDMVIISDDAANGNEAVVLGDGRDVVAAEAGEYGSRATIADFDPTEDRLAVIAEPGSATPVVTFTWDAVRGGTIVGEEDVFEFFVAGVNHQTTPIAVSYYAHRDALQSGNPYATI